MLALIAADKFIVGGEFDLGELFGESFGLERFSGASGSDEVGDVDARWCWCGEDCVEGGGCCG